MNIFTFEIKKSLKSFYIWTISLLLTFIVLMGALYPVYLSSKADVMKVLANFPSQFTQAFGFDVKTIFTFGGFYNFAFVYLGVIGAIMSTSLSIATFAREKRFKCTDFLLTKPLNRKKIFTYKLLANVVILGITNIIFIVSAIGVYSISNDTGISLCTFVLGASGLLFTQLVFMSLGIFFATFVKKIRSVSGIATAFGFGAFIMNALVNIIKEDIINFIAPLKYFEPYSVFYNNGFEVKYVITAIIVIILCISAAFIRYCKHDAYAV